MLPANALLTLRTDLGHFTHFIHAIKQSERNWTPREALPRLKCDILLIVGGFYPCRCPSPGRETRKLSQWDRLVPWSFFFLAPVLDAIRARRSEQLPVRNNSFSDPTWLPMCYSFSNVAFLELNSWLFTKMFLVVRSDKMLFFFYMTTSIRQLCNFSINSYKLSESKLSKMWFELILNTILGPFVLRKFYNCCIWIKLKLYKLLPHSPIFII